MKLAQKPGEETVYKFNVNELRELAKTAHQVDAQNEEGTDYNEVQQLAKTAKTQEGSPPRKPATNRGFLRPTTGAGTVQGHRVAKSTMFLTGVASV